MIDSYLKVICHKKDLWGEKIRSGRNIMVKMKAASRIDNQYLCAIKERRRLDKAGASFD